MSELNKLNENFDSLAFSCFEIVPGTPTTYGYLKISKATEYCQEEYHAFDEKPC